MTGLTPVDEVAPISDADRECLAEIREVLARREMLDRFGVTLLHEHFEVSDDEMLVESCDIERRVLVTRPENIADLGVADAIETSWQFTPDEGPTAMFICKVVCHVHQQTGRHKRDHLREYGH